MRAIRALSLEVALGAVCYQVLPFLVTFGITFILTRLPFTEDKRFVADLAFWSPLIYLLHGIFST